MWALIFGFALGALAYAEKPAVTPRMPEEVALTSGRVLRRVVVVRWERDRVVLKHTGGADPISFNLIAEPLRSQLPAIREAALAATEAKKDAETTKANQLRTVTGQVFVTTKGAGAYKFSGAHVRVFRAEDYERAFERQRSLLPMNYRRMYPSEQPVAEANAWVDALSGMTEVARATTDADGNYSLLLPRGEYFLACFTGRLAGGEKEQNVWVVPLSSATSSLNLHNSNMWRQPE